jgi:medium-chain acyl-[acyl-carrier-protein] hydrolase
MEAFQFEKEYKIPVYDTGPDGRLCLYSLLNYLQDIASEHAELLNFGREDLMKANHFWVLSRLAVRVEAWPEWRESIVVRTWPRGTDKLFALRDYEVRYKDGRLIASGTSSWLIVDMRSKRIQRPEEHLSRFKNETSTRSSFGRNADKIEIQDNNCNDGTSFKIRVSDLDLNLHTNNVKYIKWITDNYNLDFMMKHYPEEVEINYLAESVFGEEVMIRTYPGKEENTFCHSVIRLNDNRELARMSIKWLNCTD